MAQRSVLSIAKSQIGQHDNGNNKCKYNTWFYGKMVSGSAYPWCAVFMAWCFNQIGIMANIKGVENKAYCPSWEQWAKKTGRWGTSPMVGSIVLFDWGKDGIADHIGIVEKVINKTTIQTIEGNTSSVDNSNGGCVQRRIRSTSYVRGYIYVTIYEPIASTSKVYGKGVAKTDLYIYTSPGKDNTKKLIKEGQSVNCYGTYTDKSKNLCWWRISPQTSAPQYVLYTKRINLLK